MNDFDDEKAPNYMSEEDIVTDILLYQMTPEITKHVKEYEADELGALHEKIGHPIRNYYRLYELDNPHVNQKVGDASDCQEISQRVVDAVWSRLTGRSVVKINPQASVDDVLLFGSANSADVTWC